jgi:hypothetical protein
MAVREGIKDGVSVRAPCGHGKPIALANNDHDCAMLKRRNVGENTYKAEGCASGLWKEVRARDRLAGLR